MKLPKIFKKIILSLLTSLIVFFSFAPYLAVSAQTSTASVSAAPSGTWYNQTFSGWFSKVYDSNVSPQNEIFGERYTAAQVQWVVFSLVALLVNLSGPAGAQAVSCLMSGDLNSCGTAIQNAINNVKLTDSGTTTWASAWSVNQMSGVGYVAQKINNFHLIPVANAQGVGYGAGSPIQALWTAIRNLTFGLIILVVIVMAFMIMFRVKISPQAVVTVQSALPKIILALILITFSYAIAGFMIDLMYVVMGILATFLSSSGISTFTAPELFGFLNTSSVLALMLNYLLFFTIGIVIALFSSTAGFLWGIPGAALGAVLATIMFFVLLVVLLIALVRIMWLLLVTFVNILIQIALGPIQILLGTVSPLGGFGNWLKSLAANLAVYPTVGFLFVISFFFLAQAYASSLVPGGIGIVNSLIINNFPFRINSTFLSTGSTWSPPMTVGANGLAILWLGASFVILTLIPKTADIIKGLISGKPFAYGTAIGEAMGPAKAVGLYGAAEGMNRAEAIGRGAIGEGQSYTTPATIQTLRRLLGLKPS